MPVGFNFNLTYGLKLPLFTDDHFPSSMAHSHFDFLLLFKVHLYVILNSGIILLHLTPLLI